MAWPYQVNGVDVFRLPPDDYVVDFDNPKQQKVLEHYLVFGIGAPLAFLALLQRFYTKQYLSKGLQVDDGMPSPHHLTWVHWTNLYGLVALMFFGWVCCYSWLWIDVAS